jgi:hypothetical protein
MRRKTRLPACLKRDGTAALTAGTDNNPFIVQRPPADGKRGAGHARDVARLG